MSTETTTLTATIEDAVPPGLLDKAKPEPLIKSEDILPKAVLDAFENKRAIPYVRTALGASFGCTVPDYVVSCKTMDKYLMSKKAPQAIRAWLADAEANGQVDPLTKTRFLDLFYWRGIAVAGDRPRTTTAQRPRFTPPPPATDVIRVDFEAAESVKEYRSREYAGEIELSLDTTQLLTALVDEECIDEFNDIVRGALDDQLDIGDYDYHSDEYMDTDWCELEELNMSTSSERILSRILEMLLNRGEITVEEHDEYHERYIG